MNNTSILKKCITELESENPKLDYIRGMLETLYEMQTPVSELLPINVVSREIAKDFAPSAPPTDLDEAAILDGKARAAIDQVKAMADASTEMS